LGGGREKKEDAIDHAVGIIVHKKPGDKVAVGEPLCTVHYNDAGRLERARPLIQQSYTIEPGFTSASRPLVQRIIGEEKLRAAGS
jgi:thymidine phosphorylase